MALPLVRLVAGEVAAQPGRAGRRFAHDCCWFAGHIVAVRKEYGLTIDPREAAVLNVTFAEC